jgi:hypothetical protein
MRIRLPGAETVEEDPPGIDSGQHGSDPQSASVL